MSILTAIIITKNEEIHISRCISSIKKEVDKIVVVDSGSTDKTEEICRKMGVDFYFKKWEGYSNQINWAIKKVEKFSDWIIRIDADEIFEPHTLSIRQFLSNLSSSENGVNIKRNIYFNQSLVKYGGIYNRKILRIFRSGFGKCDNRNMDEHLIVKPKIVDSNFIFSDISLIEFKDFIIKHLNYANLESSSSFKDPNKEEFIYNKSTSILKFLKSKFYLKVPRRLRPFLFFFYRMILRGGIFDNPDGFYFHLFQGLMYRSFVEYLRYKKCQKK